jgi:hypothetical protein
MRGRVGFVHQFRTLNSEEVRAIVASHTNELGVTLTRTRSPTQPVSPRLFAPAMATSVYCNDCCSRANASWS